MKKIRDKILRSTIKIVMRKQRKRCRNSKVLAARRSGQEFNLLMKVIINSNFFPTLLITFSVPLISSNVPYAELTRNEDSEKHRKNPKMRALKEMDLLLNTHKDVNS